MPIWLQHLLALSLVAFCGAALAWQTVRSLRGTGTLGGCCAKGCSAATTSPQSERSRVLFFPSDSLHRSR